MGELYIPEGRRKNQPKVLIKPSVIDVLGEPRVDYDGLDELFRQELHVPTAIEPVIKLYGNRLRGHRGYHVPYSNTIHVNAVVSEAQEKSNYSGTSVTVLHEGRHLDDSKNHKVRAAVEVGARVAIAGVGIILGMKAGEYMPTPLNYIYAFGMPILFSVGYQWSLDPAERRAQAFAKNEMILQQYGDIIAFPAKK